ncbi:MAG: MarR family transcriptional regulator [Hyphomicrobiales bacterium]|nr:MarR family transcriptional regulator [Hyphomicrobiales bacterium]
MTTGDKLDLECFLPYQLNVLAARLSRGLAQIYQQRFGISIPEWRVIAHLARENAISVREIAARVDMDKPKVTRAAQRLEGAGLVSKKVDAGDRRLVMLALTARGRQLYGEIEGLALAYERDMLARLPADMAASLRAGVMRLNGGDEDPAG